MKDGLFFRHDISHCDNEKCKRKEDCYRYVSLKQAKQEKIPDLQYVWFNEKEREQEIEDCVMFWGFEDDSTQIKWSPEKQLDMIKQHVKTEGLKA